MNHHLYSGVIDYFATGEGSIQIFFAHRAKDADEFSQMFVAAINSTLGGGGNYFIQGADIYKGMAPESHITRFLVGKGVRNFLENQAKADDDPESREGGVVNIILFSSINFS